MNLNALDGVVIDPKERGSIAYAKARSAIELVAKNRKELRAAKQAVIQHLHGEVEQGKIAVETVGGKKFLNMVKFPDGSKAKY